MICRECKNARHDRCEDVLREERFEDWRRQVVRGARFVGVDVYGLQVAELIEANRPSRGCPCHHGEI